MTRGKRVLASVLGLVATVAALSSLYVLAIGKAPVRIGGTLPEFKLSTIGGESASFSRNDQRTLLVFLSAECPSCLKELDNLILLHEVASSRGIRLLVVVDADFQTTAPLVQGTGIENLVAFEGLKLRQEIGVNFTPAFLFIGKEGVLSRADYGYLDEQAVRSFFSAL